MDVEDHNATTIETTHNITQSTTSMENEAEILELLTNATNLLRNYSRIMSYLNSISNDTHTDTEEGVMVSLILGGALIFLVMGIITDSVMCYAIVRFKSLWSAQNFFLAAWLIPDGIKQFVRMYFVCVKGPLSFVGNTFGCLQFCTTTACGIAMLAILVDWYLVNYFPHRLEAFRGRWKTVMVVIVVVPLLIYADDVLYQVIDGDISHFAIAGAISIMTLCSLLSLFGQLLTLFDGASKVHQGNYMLVATALFAVPFVIRITLYLTYTQLFDDYDIFETILFAVQYCSLLRNVIILANNRPLYEAVISAVTCTAEVNNSAEVGVAPMEFANPTYVIHLNSENKGMAQ